MCNKNIYKSYRCIFHVIYNSIYFRYNIVVKNLNVNVSGRIGSGYSATENNGELTVESKVGIGTDSPGYILDVTGTGAMKIPVGTSTQRDALTTTKGLMRYNDTLGQFEGYGPSSWGSLGGVTSINQINKVTATDANGLIFLTGTTSSAERMRINNSGDVTVVGNLIVNGTTTTVNSTTITLDDPILTLGGDTVPGSDDNKDRGIEFRYHDGNTAKLGFMGYDDSESKFTLLTDATNTTEVFQGTKGTLIADIVGDVTGNADTATKVRILNPGSVGDRFVLFAEGSNVDNSPGVNAGVQYNTTSSTVTAGTFDGTATKVEVETAGTANHKILMGDSTQVYNHADLIFNPNIGLGIGINPSSCRSPLFKLSKTPSIVIT